MEFPHLIRGEEGEGLTVIAQRMFLGDVFRGRRQAGNAAEPHEVRQRRRLKKLQSSVLK